MNVVNNTQTVKCFSIALLPETDRDGNTIRSSDQWTARFEVGDRMPYIRLDGVGDCPYELGCFYRLTMQPSRGEHT